MKDDLDFIAGLVWGALAFWVLSSGDASALEQDKQQHIAVSAIIATTVTTALEGKTESPVLCGIAASVAVGAAKEAYDAAHPKTHTASGADLMADLIGATTGAWLGHGVYIQAGQSRIAIGISKDF